MRYTSILAYILPDVITPMCGTPAFPCAPSPTGHKHTGGQHPLSPLRPLGWSCQAKSHLPAARSSWLG